MGKLNSKRVYAPFGRETQLDTPIESSRSAQMVVARVGLPGLRVEPPLARLAGDPGRTIGRSCKGQVSVAGERPGRPTYTTHTSGDTRPVGTGQEPLPRDAPTPAPTGLLVLPGGHRPHTQHPPAVNHPPPRTTGTPATHPTRVLPVPRVPRASEGRPSSPVLPVPLVLHEGTALRVLP